MSIEKALVTVITVVLVMGVLLVVTQDLQLFPMTVAKLFGSSAGDTPPSGVTAHTVTTSDGRKLEVWFAHGSPSGPLYGHSAIFFRGNGGFLSNFLPMQQWLVELGFDTAMFNYRGYGKSTGWPSEEGLYRDSEAVWNFTQERTGRSPDKTILVGLSIGTGPSAYLASKIHPHTLVLFSPYSDIPAVAAESPILGWVFPLLRPFLRWRLPTAHFVATLKKTCLIVTHGELDRTIPPSNALRVLQSYRGEQPAHFLIDPAADHNDLFSRQKAFVTERILQCLT